MLYHCFILFLSTYTDYFVLFMYIYVNIFSSQKECNCTLRLTIKSQLPELHKSLQIHVSELMPILPQFLNIKNWINVLKKHVQLFYILRNCIVSLHFNFMSFSSVCLNYLLVSIIFLSVYLVTKEDPWPSHCKWYQLQASCKASWMVGFPQWLREPGKACL